MQNRTTYEFSHSPDPKQKYVSNRYQKRGGLRRSAEDGETIAVVDRNLSCCNGLGLAIRACPPV